MFSGVCLKANKFILSLTLLNETCLDDSEMKDSTDGPIVGLDVGSIQGLTVSVNSAFNMDIFYAVPFAEPPIDENRFEMTVPVKPWKGTKRTVVPAPFCFPLVDPGGDAHLYSENCLYLNIFRPNEIREPLPILFMVHGGGYEEGSAGRYANVNEIGSKFVSKDIIVVAIQYRLTVLGFASTGDNELPGNLGYFDQVEALKFIHRNAAALGGDSNRITIYGSSAGGSSVCALSVSPHSRDYVHQIISASGSPFAAWTTSDNVVANTKQLINTLGADTLETAKECLKRTPMNEIYKALKNIGTTTKNGVSFVTFGPRLDGRFFEKDYPELIAETAPKAILIGLTEEESLLWTLVRESKSPTAGFIIDVDRRSRFSEKDVRELVTSILPEKLCSLEIRERVLEFYLNDSSCQEKDRVFYLQKYTQIFSDLRFNIPIVWDILLRSKNKWPTYAYKSAYVNPAAMPSTCPIKSAFHGSDQRYLVLGKNQTHFFEMNENDKKMERLMVDAFVSFIKTGSPANRNFQWMPSSSAQYAELKPNPEMKTHLFADRVKFWTELSEELGYDLIRMTSIKDWYRDLMI